MNRSVRIDLLNLVSGLIGSRPKARFRVVMDVLLNVLEFICLISFRGWYERFGFSGLTREGFCFRSFKVRLRLIDMFG